jgi:type IV pilus assembly protein PilB
MLFGRPHLGRILINHGTITETQLEAALQYQVSRGCRLGEALIALDFCTDAAIARALAEQLELPFVDLYQTPPDPGAVSLIPRELALEHGALPIKVQGDRILVAVRNPLDIHVDQTLRQATEMPVMLAIAPEGQLRELLHHYYSVNSLMEATLAAKATHAEMDVEEEQVSVEKLIAAGEQISTIQVVNTLIADAVLRRASDLHIRPEEGGIRVRYRIDGRLCTIATLQPALLQSIVARIKIMCGMDISENRKPQDGNCRLKVKGMTIELRGSTLPGVFGEVVVLRILSGDGCAQDLRAIGMEPDMLQNFRRLLSAKNGMLLVTGPTGSGKTTTLYASLSYINRDDVNVLTVEDPVEVKMRGISQVQVDDKAGRSFAQTLRAMMRQDPDVIMVGEIRDSETADIACRAALTGHLVLSTLHTRHAFGTLARMLDLGIPQYMLAASLNGVMAQRLARRVCDSCACDYDPPEGLLRLFEAHFGRVENPTFRRGRGCSMCHNTGTRGRTGIYELLVVDEDLRRLIGEGVEPAVLKQHLAQYRFVTMEEDAYSKACRGVIPPEEVVNLGLGLAMTMADVGPVEEGEPFPSDIPSFEHSTLRPTGMMMG